ncbi:hypothetical protein XA68_13670 [Ophiocordyceps unilateralis]|uniref:D-serine dehydratase-like domain-containing protein n=1 Tax=Ophiocordyceps unilateralis TaxID=268505 RepID=A0A2A9PBZ4_OPHUN|nr:hypothetical protein XA68_13670 [Ophiocordyceps unilateralis]
MSSSSSSSSTVLFPTAPREALVKAYVGQGLLEGVVSTPAAVINVAAVRRNCQRMLETCAELGLAWRAHVKTHKTVELMRLQVGDKGPVRLVVSTLAEAEFLLPALLDFGRQGRAVNVLYGLPLARGAVSRLAAIAKALGPGAISVLLDDPTQVAVAEALADEADDAPLTLIKIDMGGRRAGVTVDGARLMALADAVLDAHRRRRLVLAGLYSHAGHSYSGRSRRDAVRMLAAELHALGAGAERIRHRAGHERLSLTLSVGASPTALAAQNLAVDDDQQDASSPELEAETTSLTRLLSTIRARGLSIELHAGVYPVLDLQQLAARSIGPDRLSWSDLALTILADIHTIYPDRGPANSTEALIGAGSLALGREPCGAYQGWAMVKPSKLPTDNDLADFRGWIVSRLSQEHGVLSWSGDAGDDVILCPGQRLRLWPNHACIASSHFGWYLVVDEDRKGREDEVVDVWVRARGW